MRLDDQALRQLFVEARTLRAWQPGEVPDDLLRELTDLMLLGPTSSNSLPARIVFVRSAEAKERLKPHLDAGNVERTMTAPVTAIIGYDLKFPTRRPRGQKPLSALVNRPEQVEAGGLRNSSLQGAYLIMAARALGLDCGPLGGFDNAGVDREFFTGTDIRSNFLCNLGYGDRTSLKPRAERFSFDEVAHVL
jgi:3-hydroxypropanoate dehydrogenase